MVGRKETTYEESRRKRLEENKKRMEELNLNKLAQSLRTTATSPMKKIMPRTPRQPLDLSAVRRSSRVADKPPPSYREVPIEPLGRPRSYGTKRNLLNRIYASDEDRQYALERAQELQSGLDPKIPSFVKPMLQSHVSGGFWLGLPVHFCKTYLPNYDEIMTLADEDGYEWPTKYLDRKTGLSGGWKGFAVDHELVDGDALVFQLIKPTKFQVYTIRVNQDKDNDEVPENPDVTQLDVNVKPVRASTISFLRSISLAAIWLGVHLSAGAHEAEYILTTIPPSVPWPVQSRVNSNVRSSNQPKDAQQGIQQVYR